MEQSQGSIQAAWGMLDAPTLAQVFMDAAGRINGRISGDTKPLATEVGLFVDTRRLMSNDLTVTDSLIALASLRRSDPSLSDSPFIKPIFDALAKAKIETASDSRVISEAVRGIKLPKAPIIKSHLSILF